MADVLVEGKTVFAIVMVQSSNPGASIMTSPSSSDKAGAVAKVPSEKPEES